MLKLVGVICDESDKRHLVNQPMVRRSTGTRNTCVESAAYTAKSDWINSAWFRDIAIVFNESAVTHAACKL